MSTIGHGYGSEWHLLRYLGYHRDELNRAVAAAIPGATVIEWLGSRFETDPAAIDREPPRFLDREVEGFEFLPAAQRHRLASVWPRTGSLPCWDAIARLRVDAADCWLIVEAKSHLGELRSACKAKGRDVGGGREQILDTFEEVQAELGITVGAEAWLTPYYQFANRIAFLHLLNRMQIPTRLLLIYFLTIGSHQRVPSPVRVRRMNGSPRWARWNGTPPGQPPTRSPRSSTASFCR